MRLAPIELDLSRDGLKTVLKIKVTPAIEEFFKQAVNGSTETSSKWLDAQGNGLEFYEKSENMSSLSDKRSVMDNFGNGLLDGGRSMRINVAPLRIVGASSEDGVTIETNDLLSYEEMKQYIVALGEWTQAFYENDLKPAHAAGRISFDL